VLVSESPAVCAKRPSSSFVSRVSPVSDPDEIRFTIHASRISRTPLADFFRILLEERLLLLELGQLTLQLIHAFLETLIVEAQQIETIQQLFPLDIRPFQRPPQSS